MTDPEVRELISDLNALKDISKTGLELAVELLDCYDFDKVKNTKFEDAKDRKSYDGRFSDDNQEIKRP